MITKELLETMSNAMLGLLFHSHQTRMVALERALGAAINKGLLLLPTKLPEGAKVEPLPRRPTIEEWTKATVLINAYAIAIMDCTNYPEDSAAAAMSRSTALQALEDLRNHIYGAPDA